MLSKINFISLLGLLSALSVLADGEDKMSMEDMVATLEGIGSACDPPPSKEMIEQLLRHDEDVPRETKCFARCMMEIFEMQNGDSNLLIEEKIVDFSNVMYPEQTEDIRAMVKSCNLKNAAISDKCDVTHEHSMCMMREAKERSINVPMFD